MIVSSLWINIGMVAAGAAIVAALVNLWSAVRTIGAQQRLKRKLALRAMRDAELRDLQRRAAHHEFSARDMELALTLIEAESSQLSPKDRARLSKGQITDKNAKDYVEDLIAAA